MRDVAFPIFRAELFQSGLPTAKKHCFDGAYV